MEQKRRGRINKVKLDVRQLTYSIERLINQRQLLNATVKSHIEKISEINTKIENKKDKLKELNLVISNIKKGYCDDEINMEYEENMIKHKCSRDIIKQKKIDTKSQKDTQYSNVKKHNKEYYRDTNLKRYIKNDLFRFKKNINGLPDKLKSKLLKMRSNMGYEWRNTHFFGKQHSQHKNNLTIFQKDGNKLFTHSYVVHRNGVSYNRREKVLYSL